MNYKYRTASLLFALVSLMILLVAFSVPLYNLFCRVTGYGGTTSFSENISNITLDKDITLQFNADVNDSIDWSFTAPQDVTFKIGENKLVEYEATNLSSVSSSGTATFNVLPEKEGLRFFEVHKAADVYHREACEKLLDGMSKEEQEKAEKSALSTAKYLWNFLTGMAVKHNIPMQAAA